jgi:hypothetical protein
MILGWITDMVTGRQLYVGKDILLSGNNASLLATLVLVQVGRLVS